MQVFVTGGSGYVGRVLIPRLVEEGHAVTALARSEEAGRAVEALGAGALRGSLTGERPWLRSIGEQEAVLHCAAPVEFWGPYRQFEEAIVEPTLALHDAASAAGVERFVYVSAAAVVHDGGPGRHDERDAVAPRKLSTGYARAKRTVELALAERPSSGMTRVLLRPPLIWGRDMPTIDQFAAAAGKPTWAWIDGGRAEFDAVHVDNLVSALVLAVHRGADLRPYFLTDEQPREFRAFLEALLATRGITPGTRSFPGPMARANAALMERAFKLARAKSAPPLTRWIADFAGRDHLYDDTPAREDLGYRPVVGFEDGVRGMHALVKGTEAAGAA
jgi:nucleoside-diphosphate-sugar epimerase